MWQAFDIYRGSASGEAPLLSSGSKYRLLKKFKFIKAVPDTVSDEIWHDKWRLSWQAFDIDLGYHSGEARLPSSGSE